MELSKLISNLKRTRDKNIALNLPQIRFIYALILKQMAEHTVYDTLQMRANIAKVFCETFGVSTSDIKTTPLDYWSTHGFPQNVERSWNNADSTISETLTNNKYHAKVSSNDEALYLYEKGEFEISNNPPRDNSNFITMPIGYISDLVNRNIFSSVNGLEEALRKLLNDIVEQMLQL